MDSVNVDRVLLCRVSPFGNPRIKAHLRLPVAYRSLSRPSSALSAKAFPLRPLQLDLRRHLRRAQRNPFTESLKSTLQCLLPNFDPLTLGSKFVWLRLGCIITRIRKISVNFSYFCSRSSFDDLIPTINVKTLISL